MTNRMESHVRGLTNGVSKVSLKPQTTPTKGERVKFSDCEEMAAYIAAGLVDLVDFVFCDPMGIWHHCTLATSQCKAKDLEIGVAFDGSSIRLFKSVEASDMLMKPDPSTCWVDPFCAHRTLHVVCDITDPLGVPFERCPRQIAKRASEYMRSLGMADKAFFGPEPEFFVFDSVAYRIADNEVSYRIDAEEGCWNPRGQKGHRMQKKQWYFPVAPIDSLMDLRSEMLLTMRDVGLEIEKHHHEVAASQHELGFTCSELVQTADDLMTYKYVVKNVAKINGKSATFMPKPMHTDMGNGLHVHQSLWLNGKNLFFDKEGPYFFLSHFAMHYIAGILHHAPAVIAFTNSSANSYKRLVPGFEAPSSLVYSKGNRSAAIRIPLCDAENPKAKRIECRFPDFSGCPYLTFTALLMAGLDGVQKKLTPPPAMDKDVYELTAEERKTIRLTPPNLAASLDALEEDHEFLTRGGIMPESFILAYIAYKREEIKSIDRIPHPKEYELYYQC